MPIVTLLEHLKNTQKSFDLLAGPVTLTRTKIDEFSIDESSLWFITHDNNEVQVDIKNFVKIDFDAISSKVGNSIEMHKCFSILSDSGRYNAYLRDKNDNCILSFYRIKGDM